MKIAFKNYRPSGFALVVTLSLMILLTVIAVGLLALSSISLRSTGQAESMATARANARLGMMMALGELQKAAGSDQRVTAPASLVDPAAGPGVTGVWESWKPSPDGSNDYSSRKTTVQKPDEVADGEFITWLASGDPASPAGPRSPPGAVAPSATNITLVADRTSLTEKIRGTHLAPTRIGKNGEIAWAVLDEGTKARIDLPAESQLAEDSLRQSRLRAPGRPQAEGISTNTAALRVDATTAAKLISLNQAELVAGREQLRPYLHDLTTHSMSLPINVAAGGLKADLSRAFEDPSLPNDLTSRFVYSNSKTKLAVSDPLFSTLAAYYQLYKKPVNPLQLAVPKNYRPMRGTVPNLAPLDGTLIAPVVTRVSVVFSLVSRVGHGDWASRISNRTGDNKRRNMVYLIYTPVVTVYNPYSVPIQFRDFKVTFRNLPVAFKFFRNGQPQSVKPALLSSFHISSQTRNDWEDPFSCTASNSAGSASDSLVTLYPGEARVFGTSHPPSATWGSMTNYLYQNNLDSSKTKNVFSGAGWDYRSGYIVDWLVPNISNPTADGRGKDNSILGVFGVGPTDSVNVEVSPVMPGSGGGKIIVDFQAKVAGRDTPLGIFEYNYGNQAKLTEILQNGNHSTIGKVTYPFRRERDFTVSELTLSNPDSNPINRWGSTPKQFAIFTLGTRTANDSLYPGKPGRTSSFVHHVLRMDVSGTHPALMPMEMSLLPITGTGASTVGSIDADDVNRAFHFSGTTRGNGAVHYVSQNLPTTPLVNLADFRHANLASSGHLPLVQHTVGESLASPVVPADKAQASSTFGYEVLDHAWFANQTLWDAYYFSGIRNLSDANLLFDQKPLPIIPRMVPMLAPGQDSKAAALKAVTSPAWSDLAAMLAIKGGFNVNSTSKSAWKATLTSLRQMELPVLGPIEIRDPSVNPSTYREVVRTAAHSPFPRLSRPIGDRVTKTNSMDNQKRWSGFRELEEPEIDKLVDAIITEVRTRGPFLSMAEFVNRRLGPASDDMSARGALEEAIRKSGINEIPMGPVNRIIEENEAAAFGYANPKAAAGNTEEGASAILSQGDLLSAIGASMTVRSDTFVIRSYGAARDSAGVTARAWCEAVIQRVPAFIDPADAPEKVQSAILASGRSMSDLSPVNRRFGRRFEVVSFRWLNANEV
ncbi:MAG: hypothetical protein WEB53_15470 [Akkermansiaceae bacterium]